MSKANVVTKEFLLALCNEHNIPVPTAEQALKVLVESHIVLGKQDTEIKKLRDAVNKAKKAGDNMFLEADTLLKQMEIWSQKTFTINAALLAMLLRHEHLTHEIGMDLTIKPLAELHPYFRFVIETAAELPKPDLSGFPKLSSSTDFTGKKKKDDGILN